MHTVKTLKVIVLSSHPEEVKTSKLSILNSPSKGYFMREIMLQCYLALL